MNKIVRTQYPIEKLPADLRPVSVQGSTVVVTVEEVDPRAETAEEWLKYVEAIRHNLPPSEEDAVDTIRKLRDEWED